MVEATASALLVAGEYEGLRNPLLAISNLECINALQTTCAGCPLKWPRRGSPCRSSLALGTLAATWKAGRP